MLVGLRCLLFLAVLVPLRHTAGSPVVDDGQGRRRVWVRARRLWLTERKLTVRGRLEVVLQGGWGAAEYWYRFRIPEGGAVTGLAVEQVPGVWSEGRVLDLRAASRVIQDRTGLPAGWDPGLLVPLGPETYLLRAWPVSPGRPVRARVEWVAPIQARGGRWWLSVPSAGPDRHLAALQVSAALRQGRPKHWRVPVGRPVHLDLGPVAGPGPLQVRYAQVSLEALSGPCGLGRWGLLLEAGGRPVGRRRSGTVVFVVDRSRSMGRAAQAAVRAFRFLAGHLPRGVRIGLVAFARKVKRYGVRPQVATAAAARRMARWLSSLSLDNGSRLEAALAAAVRLVRRGPGPATLVVLTDGLFGARGLDRSLATLVRGSQVFALVLDEGAQGIERLADGPLERFLRRIGGLGYALAPGKVGFCSGCRGRTCASCPLAQVADLAARADLLTHLGLVADRPGELGPGRRALSTASGFVAMADLAEPVGRLELRGNHQGRPFRVSARRVQVGSAERRDLVSLLVGHAADGAVQSRRPDPGVWRKWVRCSRSARVVTWATALVALDWREAFSRDRWRFATRWGDRFFRRLGPRGRTPQPWQPWRTRPVSGHRAVLRGRLTRRLVGRSIRRGLLRRSRHCYESVLDVASRPDENLQGRMVLVLEVARGEVSRAWLEKQEFRHARLEQCLLDAAYGLGIPYSRADRTVYQVLYPLRFRLDRRSVELLRSASYVARQPRSSNPLQDLEE